MKSKQSRDLTKVAVVQAEPYLFDTGKTIEKMQGLMNKLKAESPSLVLFPEAFLPGYPRGLDFGTVVGSRSEEGREQFARYHHQAVAEHDDHFKELQDMARVLSADLAVGVVEKETGSSTLYCSIFYFASDGKYLGKHRKLKPTGSERVIWGEGDGSTMPVFDTGCGVFGGLICWENYMPLARMAMYQQGIQIYLAPTADFRDTWQNTLRHIAVEGRCYVLGCNQLITENAYPDDLRSQAGDNFTCSGGSVIISPRGQVLAGPLWNEEGILFAEIDLDEVVKGKFELDVAGHYNRPDVFSFRVNRPE
jgi:nitrilase